MKFKIGDKVRRNPRIWKTPNRYDHGRIVGVNKDGTYMFLSDAKAKEGCICTFTGKRKPGRPMPYLESELVKASK